MKVAIFSDLHAHPFPEFSKPNKEGIPDRLWDCVSVLRDIRLYCEEHSINHVIFGGDLFHKRGVIHTQTFNLIADELRLYKDRISFLAIDGNHDQADKSGAIHALESLSHGELVQTHFLGKGHGFTQHVLDGELSVDLFSYCDSRDDFMRHIDDAEEVFHAEGPTEHRIGIFHHGFRGARVGSVLEYVVKEDIDASTLKDYRFDFIFSGHYHTRQKIHGLKNAIYIGSPLEHTRSDRYPKRKGFLVYDTETKRETLVPLNRPRFLQYTQEELDHNPIKTWDIEGHFVDVLLERGSSEDVERELAKGGARGWRVVHVDTSKTHEDAPRIDVDLSLSPEVILKRYLSHKAEDIERLGLDRRKLLSRGLELLYKAGE